MLEPDIFLTPTAFFVSLAAFGLLLMLCYWIGGLL